VHFADLFRTFSVNLKFLLVGPPKVHAFIDNSNFNIEGQYVVGLKENFDTQWDEERNLPFLYGLQMEYGRLLSLILKKRELGSNPVIVGSRPPPNDSLWDSVAALNFDVTVYERMPRKDRKVEKKVDTTVARKMMEAIFLKPPGTILLVAGDSDYCPIIELAKDFKWKTETWFWNTCTSSCRIISR
jgi:uncharacterized LabA/DUF88 family protein